MEELVSIIVPVYNVKEYVVKCIESIIAQTYKNIEIIIVDDGSTDGSGEICDSFHDSRIKILHKKNGGLSSARNTGLDVASGKFICFIDSDDYIDVDMIESLYKTCKAYESDMSICRYHIVGSNISDECEMSDKLHVYSGIEALEEMLKGKIKSLAWNKMYRKEIFTDIRFPEGMVYEDIYIMHKLFLKCKRIVTIPNKAYYYVWRDGSIMHQYSIKNTYDNYMALRYRLNDLINLNMKNIGGLYADIIRVRLYFELVLAKVDLKKRKEDSTLIKMIKEDYKSLIIPECSRKYLTENEQLKYKIFCQSEIIYHFFIKVMYDSKGRKLAEKFLKRFRKIDDIPVRERRFSNAIWIMGLPEYNNLGDCAIGYATINYIKNNFSSSDIFTVTEKECLARRNKIKKLIQEDDLIILQGGGNITDVYPEQQMIRKKILKTFKSNRIIIMPQTVYFTNSNYGKKQQRDTYRLFSTCKNLTLVCREKYTYSWVQNNFKGINSILTPDIVFSLPYSKKDTERKGIILCVRNDCETSWMMNFLPEIKELCLKLDQRIIFSDTVIKENVLVEQYKKVIENKLDEFSSAKLIITDRLHGVIFSVITNTPCIAIDNFNHKIRGICQWMNEWSSVSYVNNFYELTEVISNLKMDKEFDKEKLKKLQGEFNILLKTIKG